MASKNGFGATQRKAMEEVTPSRKWSEDKVVLVFDLETTGVDVEEDVPVSFSLVQYAYGHVVFESHQIIDPGRSIPDESIAIHHITDEIAKSFGIPLVSALTQLREALINASELGWIVLGMNVSFDLTVVDRACKKYLGKGLLDTNYAAATLDILILDRHLDRFRKGKRRLIDLATAYSVTTSEALHNSLVDSKVTLRVLLAMLDRYPELVELSPSNYSSSMFAYNEEWLQSFNKWRLSRGEESLPSKVWPIDSQEDSQRHPLS